MLTNCKNGVSSYEIHRALGVTQKTEWFMLQHIRLSMQDEDDRGKQGGEVEVDKMFISGLSHNIHKDNAAKMITGTGDKEKAIVLRVLERGNKVLAKKKCDSKKITSQAHIRQNVCAVPAVFSDELQFDNWK